MKEKIMSKIKEYAPLLFLFALIGVLFVPAVAFKWIVCGVAFAGIVVFTWDRWKDRDKDFSQIIRW